MDDSMMNPHLEQKLAAATDMLEGWQFVLDMLDGEIAEAQRHGWDPGQARMLVFAMFMHTMMSPILGHGPRPDAA